MSALRPKADIAKLDLSFSLAKLASEFIRSRCRRPATEFSPEPVNRTSGHA